MPDRGIRRPLPDFLIIGAPKAGSTALHDALATHPQLYASPIKEPKYFLTDGTPPDPAAQRGPGDAHSAREWLWRRRDYERLFAQAPAGSVRFESTPFYLWDRTSHVRIARTLGLDVKLIAVIRDPIDRAFSNWSHLRADGLEPEPDFLSACLAEPQRVAAGWAPFWRYLELGRYGEQFEHLFRHVAPERVRVIRYRQLIDAPAQTLNDLCAFLGVDVKRVTHLPDSNLGRWADDGKINTEFRRAIRAGARLGRVHPSALVANGPAPAARSSPVRSESAWPTGSPTTTLCWVGCWAAITRTGYRPRAAVCTPCAGRERRRHGSLRRRHADRPRHR
jgi:hypothetical protein